MIRLRPHHFLCMLTYKGEGYSPRFVENFTALMQRLNAGEHIEIISGPDDICAPLCVEEGAACHCLAARNRQRDDAALADLADCLGRDLTVGTVLAPSTADLETLRTAFRDGGIRTACAGCEWFELCSEIAISGYRATHLQKNL